MNKSYEDVKWSRWKFEGDLLLMNEIEINKLL